MRRATRAGARVIIGLVIAANAGAGGCRSGEAEAPSAPAWEVVSEGPGRGSLDPAVAGERAGSGVRRFARVGEGEPGHICIEEAPDPEGAASGALAWVSTRRACDATGVSGADEPLSVAHLRQDAAGSIALSHSVERGDGVVTWFEPALVIVPAGLGAGEVTTQELRMIVRPIGKPGVIRHQGRARHEITHVGEDVVRLRGGEPMKATHVRLVLTADLGLPKVRVVTDRWYVAGVGLVGERIQERATTLGLTVRSVDEQWVLDAPGAAR
ncbi:MAG: hypothetical protein AB7K52_14625 [Phycisphaerales bacterium]